MNGDIRRPSGKPIGNTTVKNCVGPTFRSSASSSSSSSNFAAAAEHSTNLPKHKQPISRGNVTTSKNSGAAGAVDEDDFANAFDDVPKIHFFSGKELLNHLLQIRETLENANCDWEKRMIAVKKVRSLVVADACQHEEFMSELKNFEVPFQMLAKDLRSQIVREACITIAFLSQKLGQRFEHFAESIFLGLINLIQNSAKIMATSGHVTCRYIIKNTHTPKLIPIIIGSLTSKSREIRRACVEFISLICCGWSTGAMEKNVTNIQEAIRQTLSDADPDARQAARKAYCGFRDRFKEKADGLFESLDPAKQKLLMGEMSKWSSSNNGVTAVRPSQQAPHTDQMPAFKASTRSASEVDNGAQTRARRDHMDALSSRASRTAKAAAAPVGVPRSMSSLPPVPMPTQSQQAFDVTITKSTYNESSPIRKSVFQPGRRSNSPSSRLPTATLMARRCHATSTTARSCLPGQSQSESREQTPTKCDGRLFCIDENDQTATPAGSSSSISLNATDDLGIFNAVPKKQEDVVYPLARLHLTEEHSSNTKTQSSVSPAPFGRSRYVASDTFHDCLNKSEVIQQYRFTDVQKVVGNRDSGIEDVADSFHKNDNAVANGHLLNDQLNLNIDDEIQQEIIEEILTELRNHNRRNSERRKAMRTLRFMTRHGYFSLWNTHFETVLEIVLKTLDDNDKEILSSALGFLGDICVLQSTRFCDCAEFTVLKVLEKHNDPDKEVSRAADECAQLLAANLPPRICLQILKATIKLEDSRATLAAIKMLAKVVQQSSASDVENVLADVMPGIIHGYENPDDSLMRKASLFCLVALHNFLGPYGLAPYLSSLSTSKVTLLNSYLISGDTTCISSPSVTTNIRQLAYC